MGLDEQRFDRGAVARHFRRREARIFGIDDALKVWGERHHAFFGNATIMSSSTRAPGEES